MKEKCRNCRFWDIEALGVQRSDARDYTIAECRAHAPGQPTQPRGRYGRWPETAGDEGCGDFRQFVEGE